MRTPILISLLLALTMGQARADVKIRPNNLNTDPSLVWRLGGVRFGPNGAFGVDDGVTPGTVSSVNVATAVPGLSFTGGPITGSGSITFGITDSALFRAAIGANDAANLTTGTIPDARLSSNIPRFNADNKFTANVGIGSGLPGTLVDPLTVGLASGKYLGLSIAGGFPGLRLGFADTTGAGLLYNTWWDGSAWQRNDGTVSAWRQVFGATSNAALSKVSWYQDYPSAGRNSTPAMTLTGTGDLTAQTSVTTPTLKVTGVAGLGTGLPGTLTDPLTVGLASGKYASFSVAGGFPGLRLGFADSAGAGLLYNTWWDGAAWQRTDPTTSAWRQVFTSTTGASTSKVLWYQDYPSAGRNSTPAMTLTGDGNLTLTGHVITPALQVTGGTPGTGKVLTSDASGNATWAAPSGGGTAESLSSGGFNFQWSEVQDAWTADTNIKLVSGSFVGDGSGLTNLPAANLTGTASVNTTGTASNITGTVAVANGGTGATTASAARTALGADNASNLTTGTLPIARQADYRNERGIGGYKLDSGLARWFQSLGNVGKTASGTGLGGSDILLIGDSIEEGANATTFYDTWAHILKTRLQDHYNPPGVTGGYGFLPSISGTSTTAYAAWPAPGAAQYSTYGSQWTGTGTWTWGNGGSFTSHKGAISSTSGAKMYTIFDGTDAQATRKRMGVTDIEPVGADGPVIGNWWVDNFEGGTTFGTAGAGGQTEQITATSTLDYGHRWPLLSGLDPTQKNLVQVTSPASGQIYFDGVVAYNGDTDCGVRLHNLATFGKKARDYLSAAVLNGISKFGANSGTGAHYARLAVMDFITNDALADSVTTANLATKVAAYQADYGTLIDTVLAYPSKPAVLLVIPPMEDVSDADTRNIIYPAFVDAVYALADARSNVAVINCNVILGSDIYGNNRPFQASTGRGAELGWNSGNTHISDNGSVAMADYLYRALTH